MVLRTSLAEEDFRQRRENVIIGDYYLHYYLQVSIDLTILSMYFIISIC